MIERYKIQETKEDGRNFNGTFETNGGQVDLGNTL